MQVDKSTCNKHRSGLLSDEEWEPSLATGPEEMEIGQDDDDWFPEKSPKSRKGEREAGERRFGSKTDSHCYFPKLFVNNVRNKPH